MRNLTLLTDLYELTMMQGYFFEGNNDTVVFDILKPKITARLFSMPFTEKIHVTALMRFPAA